MRDWIAARVVHSRSFTGLVVLCAAGLVAAGTLTCTSAPPVLARAAPSVHVVLEPGAEHLQVSMGGPYQVLDGDDLVLARGPRLRSGLIQAQERGQLELNGLRFATATLRLLPAAGDRFEWNGREYPGELCVRLREDGSLELTNRLDLETYVAGVLFAEMPASFPEEALKAQAVAARTYAWIKLCRGERLLATEMHQVYRGRGSLPAQARRVVAATAGQVLTYRGAPLEALFSSTCGAATGDAGQVFGSGKSEAPLRGVACGHCADSPLYRWSRQLDPRRLAQCLELHGPVSELEVRERDRFGRSLSLNVRAGGTSRAMNALKLRAAWNAVAERAESLPSSFFRSAALTGQGLRIEGSGYGHGVGLCQYGAQGMARDGADYRRILGHYYPGADLETRW